MIKVVLSTSSSYSTFPKKYHRNDETMMYSGLKTMKLCQDQQHPCGISNNSWTGMSCLNIGFATFLFFSFETESQHNQRQNELKPRRNAPPPREGGPPRARETAT